MEAIRLAPALPETGLASRGKSFDDVLREKKQENRTKEFRATRVLADRAARSGRDHIGYRSDRDSQPAEFTDGCE